MPEIDSGAVLHLALHVIVPALVALVPGVRHGSRTGIKCFAMMMAAMIIDIDHLLATPIFDPARCSIGFHPLHTWYAGVVYLVVGFAVPASRWFVAGVGIHLALDALDCVV